MFRQRITHLQEWQNSPARRPLLLRGARQVGKTYLIMQFAKKCFSDHVTINFEKNPEFKECFDQLDPEAIIQHIELLTNRSILPGKTLLFLDEIQDCPKAIMALRYFYEELPELHIIGAGSLLEFALSDTLFRMPVGRVSFMYLYPMSFMEVLLALGEEKLHHFLSTLTLSESIPDIVHSKLLKLLQVYYFTGGMPHVVKLYAEHRNISLCRDTQMDLLNSYRADFGKYASLTQQGYCDRVFSKAPSLIATHIRYKDIDPDMDYRGLKQAIQLLFKANVLHPIYRSTANGLPLNATHIDKHYKLLFIDLGLANAAGQTPPATILKQDHTLLNRGALTEQYVGQQLLSMHQYNANGELFYWKRDANNSQAEIDYVVSCCNQIIPLEVKSGSSGRLKSMHLYMQEKNTNLGIKLSTDRYDTSDTIWSIPLYLVEQLERLILLKTTKTD